MNAHVLAALPLVASLVAGHARAQSRPAETHAPVNDSIGTTPPATRWYGGQTLTVDAAALLVTTIGVATRGQNEASTGLVVSGLVGTLVGGPIVHWCHGRVGTGFKSLGVRLGAPVGAALWFGSVGVVAGLVLAAGDPRGAFAFGGVGAFGGLVLGSVTSMAVDAAVFAREPASSPPERGARVQLAPMGSYDPQRKLTYVGVAGSF